MGVHKSRCGSLQIWPRRRAKRILPSANWNCLPKSDKPNLLGFIGYKVGMISAYAKDNTADSMTKGKKIAIPATIIECPELRIFSVRFYKNSKVLKEVIIHFDDSLKRKLKKPKEIKPSRIDEITGFDDIRITAISETKKTGFRKNPEILEIGLSGSKEEKLKFIKEKLNKEIKISEVISQGVVDIHAVTKAYGTQGPVRRFGIGLKFHKSEKGVRRPGALGPWHPSRVTFRVSNMGQTGLHTRIVYNSLILQVGRIGEKDINKKEGFHKYGNINTDYIILKGSVPGTEKRPILMTLSQRPTISATKQKYEVIELR
jgi:large subunit ribosomal protein L3